MARISRGKYNLQILPVMAVYVLLMIFEWPLIFKVHDLALRTVLALLPAVPVVIVIALIARRVMGVDELEQRMHLIALSIAVGVVSAASIVGGFLVAAKVWQVDGGILLWVFPAFCLVYGPTRMILMRKVTGVWNFWNC